MQPATGKHQVRSVSDSGSAAVTFQIAAGRRKSA